MTQDTSLRGKCEEYAKAAAEADSTLTVVRGWYVDPIWGREEHWWTTRPDGTIYDPTAAQFPMGGVAEWYEPFAGLYPCGGCGTEITEETARVNSGYCCGHCYAVDVGLAYGSCRCGYEEAPDA